MVVRSSTGTDDWTAFASVGGRPGDGPLELPAGVTNGWTPSGNFLDLGHDRGIGKIHVDPRDSNFYLAVNSAARTSLAPETLEAAFIYGDIHGCGHTDIDADRGHHSGVDCYGDRNC